MIKSINKSMSIKILLGLIIMGSVLFAGYLVNANAVGNVDPATTELVKNSLSEVTNNEFGSPVVTDETEINNKRLVIAEDSKNKYKVNAENGKIITLTANDLGNLINKEGQISSTELSAKAKKYLEKYHPSAVGEYYILSHNEQKNTTNANYNQFIFEEVASNGIKTGESVALDVNNAGDLIGLAVHEGNRNVVENTQPKLTRADAVKIAVDRIKNEVPILKDADFSQDNSEITVWQERLVWKVEFEDLKVEKSPVTTDYEFRIDALTGDILFSDHTK